MSYDKRKKAIHVDKVIIKTDKVIIKKDDKKQNKKHNSYSKHRKNDNRGCYC
ncbi:hypothetical protein [Priestia megaterium]